MMKHRALTHLMAPSLALLVVLGFACLDATNIPPISNDLRDALAETYGSAGAPPVASAGQGGSAMTPSAGAGGGGEDSEDDDPPPSEQASGGAAGSGMAEVAGSGDVGMEPSTPVGAGCDGFAILEQYCSTAGCHGQPDAPLGDFASSEEAARAFVGREGSLACTGQGTVIDPDNPEDSLLISKVAGDPPCGQQMPPTGEPLSEEEVTCLQDWIAGF